MENRRHYPGAVSPQTKPNQRLPTNIHYSDPVTNSWKVHSQKVYSTQPSISLHLDDQFAFRTSGSTAAAIIAMLQHPVRTMLTTNSYVHIFSFDFSKAFDTVMHVTLIWAKWLGCKYQTTRITGSTTFRRTLPLHQIRWTVLDSRWSHYTGIRAWPRIIRCHCRRFASSRRNESFVQVCGWHLSHSAGGQFKLVQHGDITH